MCQCTRLAILALIAASAGYAVTVGFTRNPPYAYPDRSGAAAGFVVDVLNEAARRADVNLNWKFVEGSGPLWTRDPDVEIWPAGVSSDERRQHFHITRPWWRTDLIVVTRSESGSLDDLSGKRIAATRDLQTSLRSRLPEAHIEPSATHIASAVSLCTAAADAFVTDRVILDGLLAARPSECAGVAFQLLALPDATLDLSMLAVPAARDVAERLYAEIASMERGGDITTIALRYPQITAASARFMTSIIQSEHKQDRLRLVLALVSVLLAVTGGLLFRMYREVGHRRRTERALRETNSDLQQFSYAASHDLSEPLRNMVLYSEVLERRYGERLDDDGRRFISVIRQGGRRMQRLLDSLRDYTELSREIHTPTEIDSQEVLRQAMAELHERIAEAGAAITYDPLPKVRFRESRLLQVFQNLISNALKYRSHGPPKIHVSARKTNNIWTFCVEDNGIGIQIEYQQKIFDAFKRLHPSDVPGAGLGLAICKRIVEREGGQIWVESLKNHGAKFYFTIRA